MKLKIFLISLLPVLFLGSCGKSGKSEREIMGLKGNVKELKETTYDAVVKFGEIVSGDITKYSFKNEHTFDKKGNVLTKSVLSNWSGNLSRFEYEYGSDGNLMEAKRYGVDNELKEKTIFVYEKGVLKEQISYGTDGELLGKSVKDYSQGHLSEVTYYNQDGDISSKEKYKRDDKGNISEVVLYDSEGDVNLKVAYECNADNLIVSEVFSYENLDSESKSTYEYPETDSHKNWTKKIKYGDGEPVEVTIRDIEYY